MKQENAKCPQCGQDLRLPSNIAGLVQVTQASADAMRLIAENLNILADKLDEQTDTA